MMARGGGIFCEHQCGWGARLGGMTNANELPINVVKFDKPKMLTGLNQKVCGRLLPLTLEAHGRRTAGE